MLLLTSVLFFLRYIASRRVYDYCLGLLFVTLSIFSKDYGLIVVGVIMALVAAYGINSDSWKSDISWWWKRLLPLFLTVIVYLGLRYAIVGPLPSDNLCLHPTTFAFSYHTQGVVVYNHALEHLVRQ